MIGSSRSGERRDAKEFLDDKLRTGDSALVILIEDAQWDLVDEATRDFGGEELIVQLTPEAQAEIEKLPPTTTWPAMLRTTSR